MSSVITSAIETVFNLDNISTALVPSEIDGVKKFNQTIKVESSVWEEYLKKIEQECAVKWIIYNKQKRRRIEDSDASVDPTKKVRAKRVVFSQTYECHRAGKYVSVAKADGRSVQKKSKKCGCLAQLKVVCYTNTPEFYVFQPINSYVNHIPGDSTEDLRTLPLAPTVLNEIEQQLLNSSKLPGRVRTDILRKLDNQESRLHGRTVSYHDIWNQLQKINKKLYLFHNDDVTSFQIWLNEILPRKGFMIFHGNLALYSNDSALFAHGFISPEQQVLLEKSRTFFMDATYSISRRVNDILYSIVVRDEQIDRGYPVAYMITNDHTFAPISQWLQYLKNNNLIVNPQQITIDCSQAETTAVKTVFPSCEIQHCLFHVSQEWNRQLNLKVKYGETAADNRAIRREMMTELKSMLFEDDVDAFHHKIEKFFDTYSSSKEFLDYFEKEWCSEAKFKTWSRAYHPLELSHMLTNNYVESWHNQLKSVYLMRNRNKRLDRLVYILTEEVKYDLEKEKIRILENTGAMTRAQRERRRVELEAERIPEELRSMMIRAFEDEDEDRDDADVDVEGDVQVKGRFMVQSFTSEEVVYSVSVDNSIIQNCSCYYYQKNQRLCKHIHLLKLHVPHLSLASDTNLFSDDAPITDQSNPCDAEEISQTEYNLAQTSSMITTLYHSRNDLLKTKNSATPEETELLKSKLQNYLNALQAYMDKHNNLIRMNTQRQ